MLLQKSNTNSFELPSCKQVRFDSLDVLRGIALCGVFITHFICQFYGLAFPIGEKAVISTPFDSLLERVLRFILFDKPRGMFSFLFGVGFYYQLHRIPASGPEVKTGFLKRLTVLFLFGLVHSSFLFQGDVLRYYAILGVLLFFSYKIRPAFLLAGAILFCVALPCICTFFPNDLFIGTINTPATLAIFGQFLLGFWVARKKVFENLSFHLPHLRRVFRWSIVINICFAVSRSLFHFAEVKHLLILSAVKHDLLDLTFVVGIQVMILTFISGILLLYTFPRWKLFLKRFIPAGKMTLTNYIAQSVIAILLFEAGVYQMLGTMAAFLVSIGLCMLQLYTSRWWLQYYKSGPLEWIWRSLASMKWEPERRQFLAHETATVMKAEREKEAIEPAMTPGLTA